jgi:uncharacterized protein (TIGR00725 family)
MSSQVSESEVLSTRIIELLDRLTAIQLSSKRFIQPVGIIGPGDGGARECDAAYQISSLLGKAGMSIVSGGRGGVMEAASRGAFEAGGTTIGILPEEDDRCANRFLSVAIPTGIGEMRNALIARSSICLVAIGGGMGTISEMALGLKWGKTVFSLYEDIQLPGTKSARDINQLIESVTTWLVCQKS